MPKSCRNVVNLDAKRLHLDQFVDTFEDFFALAPRKFARAKNRVIIDCEPSSNAGYCGKFTVSDSTGYCGIVSKPLAEHMSNMLNFHANCLSPLSGVSFFLLNLLIEIDTTKCQWVLEYSNSKIDSIDAVFTTDGCDTKYYIPLYRSACNHAYLHLDSSSLSVIQDATIQYLSDVFIDNNSIIFDANLPFRHLPCHNISYKSEMPKLSFDDFARYLPSSTSVTSDARLVLSDKALPSVLSLLQIANNESGSNLIWGSEMHGELKNAQNEIYVVCTDESNSVKGTRLPQPTEEISKSQKISYIMLKNPTSNAGYVIYYDKMPCVI